MAYDVGDLCDVAVVVHEAEGEATDGVECFAAFVDGEGCFERWFVGPHVKACESHAAAFFEACAALGKGGDGLPGGFAARSSTAVGDTAREFGGDRSGFFG